MSRALFLIKFTHTAIFLVMAGSILFIVYSGIIDEQGTPFAAALMLVSIECVVFALNRFRCPLTKLAQQYGDPSGGNDFIADIFLPARFARLIPTFFGALFFIGLLLNLWRWLTP